MAQEQQDILGSIDKIEVEAVINKTLMKVTFKAGTNPVLILDGFKALDPDCKVRDDFPSKAAWGGGNRELKTAYVLSIRASNTSAGKFIELSGGYLVDGKEEEITINVGKDDSEKWLSDVLALNKLSDTQIDKLNKALNDKNGKTTLLIKDKNCFGAEFYVSKNGAAYLSKMTPEHPEKPKEEDED